MDMLIMIGILVAVAIVFMGAIGLMFAKLYNRATKEVAFVRTGSGGQKVVMDGGALVIPVLHETAPVNMKTLRLTVKRDKQSALITKDKMRVDVEAEFYVRVKPETASIAAAAQTLGDNTMQPELLRNMIEGKFVDALRSVAAGMEMNSLHENRSDFVQEVQNTLNEDLAKNGLELESVSLTGLDQTSAEYFDETNAFDAEGLKKLKEITEQRRKERNVIEADTRVAIEEKNLEADQRSLELAREKDYATMSQEREVTVRKAEQEREIAEKQAGERKAAELARIEAERETESAEIAKQRAIKQAEIERAQALEAAEIAKEKTVKIAEQERAIEVAKKSEEESKARADAETARAEAITAEQSALTAEATAVANRQKDIAVINERAEAEKKAAGILVAAEAEKTAAEDRAAARLTEAQAAKEAAERQADADAYAISKKATAMAEEYRVEAEGKEAINAAADKLPQAERELQMKLALINNMANIVSEMAKPIGEIDSIRVLDMNGGPFAGPGADGVQLKTGDDGKPVLVDSSGNNLPAQVVDSLMKYKVNMPLLQQLADEIGVDLSQGLGGAVKALEGTGFRVDTEELKPTRKARTAKKPSTGDDEAA